MYFGSKYFQKFNSKNKIINSKETWYYDSDSYNTDSSFVIKNYKYDNHDRIISEITDYSNDYIPGIKNSIFYEYFNDEITEYNCYGEDTLNIIISSVKNDKILNKAHYLSKNRDTVVFFEKNIYDKYLNLCRTENYTNYYFDDELRLSYYFDYYWDTKKLDDKPLSKTFTIYPNPVSNMLFIKYEGAAEILDFKIYSTNGKIIKQGNSKTDRINISDIPIGTYIIHLQNFNYSQKFIKNY